MEILRVVAYVVGKYRGKKRLRQAEVRERFVDDALFNQIVRKYLLERGAGYGFVADIFAHDVHFAQIEGAVFQGEKGLFERVARFAQVDDDFFDMGTRYVTNSFPRWCSALSALL